MRFPWLQVDADFLATGAGDLAELLRMSEAEAGWAMVRLWGWAISKAETPEGLGLLADEDMQRLAERAAGWKGEPGAFLMALLKPAIGLAQREESGAVRLAGMERYASTLRRMEADRARKSGRGRKDSVPPSTGVPPELPRKTQTQTQTQKEERQLPSAAAVASPVGQVELLEVEAESAPQPLPAKKPRKPAEGPHGDLWRTLEAEYERRMGAKYASGNGGADGTTVSWLLANATPSEAIRRWGLLLEWSKASPNGYPTVNGFAALRQHWNAREVVGLPVSGGRAARPEMAVGRGASGPARECAGCGKETGEGWEYGPERTWIGHYCSCGVALANMPAHPENHAEWARKRRAGRAA